jgi:hypothetical protein
MTSCPGCIEKTKRLKDAVNLLRRGVKMLHRVGWEPGETDDEWRQKAVTFLAVEQMEYKMESTREPKP